MHIKNFSIHMFESFSKVLTNTRKQEKEVTFTIYPSEIKYRQVQFTSLGKKKLGSTVFKVIATEMKSLKKKFTWQYGICLTIKTYHRLESHQSLNFSKLWWCTRQFLYWNNSCWKLKNIESLAKSPQKYIG